MNYQEFLIRLKQIKEMNYVPSHREGDTGIGKTLEDLLDIEENNISGADFGNYELKAARKGSSSMLTLFTKAPLPASANMELLNKCGYGELHNTLDALTTSSCGLKLAVRDKKLFIDNNKNVLAYYDNHTLKECFEKKYNTLLYVLADSHGSRMDEYFWFNEAYVLDGFSFERFSELIIQGILKVDIRIGHYPDGRLHDHGTGFRIMPKYLPMCFKTRTQIL
jgi:hypothetical protein